jgi:hypothetical protein
VIDCKSPKKEIILKKEEVSVNIRVNMSTADDHLVNISKGAKGFVQCDPTEFGKSKPLLFLNY